MFTYSIVITGPEHVGKFGHVLHLLADLPTHVALLPDKPVRGPLSAHAVYSLVFTEQPVK